MAPARFAVWLALSTIVPVRAGAQSRPFVEPAAQAAYQRLLPQIEKIKIFDQHAHPGFADDQDVDPGSGPAAHLPLKLTPLSADWAAAARAMATLPTARTGYTRFNAMLDRLGIETSLANRIEMADYLDPARFKWVFYVDCFMFPFDNSALAARNADEAAYMPKQSALLVRFERQSGFEALPARLDDYLRFVTASLERNKARGAIAVKFEASYFRSLSFDDPPRESAETLYAKYRASGTPTFLEYKTFQDFVFRYLIAESGRLRLAVHIHSSAGAGDYYSVAGANVLNLEPVLHDPRYLSTTFVLIHGGWPYEREAAMLASMPNVYIDSSATGSFLLYPDAFKRVLRTWLELQPLKTTFGSDAFPLDERTGPEAVYWFAVHNARTSLAAALAEMVTAREITEATALRFAHAYLHDTAAGLYGMGKATR